MVSDKLLDADSSPDCWEVVGERNMVLVAGVQNGRGSKSAEMDRGVEPNVTHCHRD